MRGGSIPLSRERHRTVFVGGGLAVIAALAAPFLLPPAANAAFPGRDGEIAYVGTAPGPNAHAEVWVVDKNGSHRTQLTSTVQDNPEVSWSPNGTRIVLRRNQIGGEQLITANADDSGETVILTDSAAQGPKWSPDGSKIAFADLGSGRCCQIFTIGATGSGITQLTSDTGADYLPAWSPDGSLIAFTGDSSGAAEIYTLNVVTGVEVQLTTNVEFASASWASWSPDGRMIAFSVTQGGKYAVYTMNADGTNPTQITHDTYNDFQPAWSPDGKLIVFVSDRSGQDDLYTMHTNGAGIAVIPGGASTMNLAPDWQPVGRT